MSSEGNLQCPLHALVVILHGTLLQDGFQCVTEQADSVPGFAPTLRDYVELGLGQFLPARWDADTENACLLYKHKRKPGKVYCLATIAFEGVAVVTFSQRGGAESTTEITLDNYIQLLSAPDALPEGAVKLAQYAVTNNAEELKSKLRTLTERIVPDIQPSATTSSSSGVDYGRYGGDWQQPPVAPFVPPSYMPPVVNPVDIGRSDLDPFSNINPRQGIPAPSGPGGFASPSGGMFVGPDHPVFQPSHHYPPNQPQPPLIPEPPFLPGFAPPQPRFDPLGPVFGPNRGGNFYGDDDINNYIDPAFPGGFGRGGGGGRGAGRGGRAGPGRGPGRGNLFPGEPNPDHFKPPGW